MRRDLTECERIFRALPPEIFPAAAVMRIKKNESCQQLVMKAVSSKQPGTSMYRAGDDCVKIFGRGIAFGARSCSQLFFI